MDKPLPTARPHATELRSVAIRTIDARRAQKTDERALRRQELAERLPLFLSATVPEEAAEHVAELLRQAACSGEMRADIFRFPSEYCTDRGRAINNGEPEWPSTLQGLALAYFEFLRVEFHPLGYSVSAEIVTWPMLMPGDAALFLNWYGEQ